MSVIDGIASLVTVERNPNWTIELPAASSMPACAVFDGSETAEDQNTRDMLIRSNVAVEVWVIKPTLSEALTELNNMLGEIRLAVASNQLLGGYAQRVRYLGCDEPQPIDLTASPVQASIEAQFEIERFEQHATPYA